MIGVIYAALVAAMQTDLKRLIAYSSVSHIGVIMLAIFALTSIGISGAVIQMVSHTITTGALFIILAGLYARRQSYAIKDFGGLMGVMPAFTAVFLIATLSSVALPSTSGFTGELLMLMGSFQTHPWATGFATTAAIWSVVYMLWMFQRVMYGPITNDANQSLPDWTRGEKWALGAAGAADLLPRRVSDPDLEQTESRASRPSWRRPARLTTTRSPRRPSKRPQRRLRRPGPPKDKHSMTSFSSQDLLTIMPMLIIVITAMVVLMVDLGLPRDRKSPLVVISFIGIVIAAYFCGPVLWDKGLTRRSTAPSSPTTSR